MADIKELGESLLTRQQTRNDRQYKESKREAYKIGLATAGVGMINEHLKNKAVQFLTSEPVLAQKAKYRAAVAQADRIGAMHATIQESGKTAEEWFLENRYMPAMEEQYKAKFGTEFVPQSYLPSLRAKAYELSQQEASNFSEALAAAQTVPDLETAMQQADSVLVPPTNAGASLFGKIKGLLSGKTEDDYRRESLERVEAMQPMANESVRTAFDKVSRLQGYEAAVEFVQRLDTSGFEKNQKVEVKTDLIADPNKNGILAVSIETITDDLGNNISQKVTHELIETLANPEEKDRLFRQVVDKADFPNLAEKTLTPAANSMFARRLNERGLNMLDIADATQFREISRVYQDVASNKQNLRDDVRAEGFTEMMSAGLAASERFLSDITATEIQREGSTPESIMQVAIDAIDTVFDSNQYINSFDAVETPTTVYPTEDDEPTDWFQLQ